jgi:ubiquinone/menaquinone biosynthesis C-methylase UbiE
MRSDIEWKKWGQIDPLFSRAPWPGKKEPPGQAWSEQAVFALGESDWADCSVKWRQYGLSTESCFEIGCGPGRMTRYLHRTFSEVHASDVSPDQIAFAQRYCDPAYVTFHLTEGANLPVPDESISAVFSVYVFQVFDSHSDAADYLRQIHRVLMPGNGTLMIQLPVHEWPSAGLFLKLWKGTYAAKRRLGDIRAAYQRFWIRHGQFRPLRRTISYEAGWLFSTLASLGFKDVELRTFCLSSNPEPHTFVFARKAPAA